MANPKNLRVVQAGVNTTNGNATALGAPYKVGTVRMPVQPKNKPWVPNWHPKHPANTIV